MDAPHIVQNTDIACAHNITKVPRSARGLKCIIIRRFPLLYLPRPQVLSEVTSSLTAAFRSFIAAFPRHRDPKNRFSPFVGKVIRFRNENFAFNAEFLLILRYVGKKSSSRLGGSFFVPDRPWYGLYFITYLDSAPRKGGTTFYFAAPAEDPFPPAALPTRRFLLLDIASNRSSSPCRSP